MNQSITRPKQSILLFKTDSPHCNFTVQVDGLLMTQTMGSVWIPLLMSLWVVGRGGQKIFPLTVDKGHCVFIHLHVCQKFLQMLLNQSFTPWLNFVQNCCELNENKLRSVCLTCDSDYFVITRDYLCIYIYRLMIHLRLLIANYFKNCHSASFHGNDTPKMVQADFMNNHHTIWK